eukprot:TRINITY_DN31928_c0_g1_i1.p1 TRINITY_DN31928_c0_g1~~TRINITY_DN31928_c0_g1_i1.p1  ORF type:complete len:306 (+),score=71.36 TRINITY_DN31928_c0_g1_i1:57-974(+)
MAAASRPRGVMAVVATTVAVITALRPAFGPQLSFAPPAGLTSSSSLSHGWRGMNAAGRTTIFSSRLSEGCSTGGPAALAVGVLAFATLAASSRKQKQSGSYRARPATAMRAVTEIAQIKLLMIGGKATPAPPVGPAIGAQGLNIAMFVKEYNAMTSDKVGETCPCVVHVMSDKSFTIELKTPPTAALLHKAVGASKGSGKPNSESIGTISLEKLEEIARIKQPDLGMADVWRAMKSVHGTAKASGVKVEGYEEWLEKKAPPKPKSILQRYGPGLTKLPQPWGNGPPCEDGYWPEAGAGSPVQEEK